jgi:hypothetical protein
LTHNTRAADRSGSKGLCGRRRAPRSCSRNPHVIPMRKAPVPQSRARHIPASTAAISGASAVFRGFRPASLATATTRDLGHLSLVETVSQQVVRGNDPSHAGPFLWRVRMQLAGVGPTTPTRARRLADASVDPTDARTMTARSPVRTLNPRKCSRKARCHPPAITTGMSPLRLSGDRPPGRPPRGRRILV